MQHSRLSSITSARLSKCQAILISLALAAVQLSDVLTAVEPALTVTGKVTDDAGKPIAGAVVRMNVGGVIRAVATGADGVYRLVGYKPGEARLVVFAKGRAPQLLQIQIANDMRPLDFRLRPGQTVRARILDERGNPIPKARIVIRGWGGEMEPVGFLDLRFEADTRGVWEWNEAPASMFAADISRPGGMQLSYQPLVARKLEYVFRVPLALAISGSVVDAETRQPIKKFRVVHGTRRRKQADWNGRGGSKFADGQYHVRETSDAPIYLLRIEAEGYWPAVSREIKNDEGNVSIDFRLTKGKDVEGIVLTPEGTPAVGAKVALGRVGARVSIVNGEIDEIKTAGVDRQHTDSSGRFHLGPQSSDFALVITHPSGYAHVECSHRSPTVFKLTPWARLEGTYRVARKLQPHAELWINHSDYSPFHLPHVLLKYRQTTDGNGRFVFERVVPGRGGVGRKLQWNRDDGFSEMSSSCLLPAEFKPGKTTHIDLGTSGRPVIGQLRWATGSDKHAPWRFFVIGAEPGNPKLPDSPMQVVASIERDGSFSIDDVPIGKYELNLGVIASSNVGEDPPFLSVPFTVPAINEKLSQRPVDLGVLTLKVATAP
jgi:protocatechuate 3,4-dioxygenase beta subunit